MTRSLKGCSLVVLACVLAAQAQNTATRLVQDWQAFIGQGASSAVSEYQAAVCPDGSTYASDGADRVVEVDAHGQTLFDQRNLPDIKSVAAIACDAGSRLVVVTARPRLINVVQPMNGALVRTSSYSLESPVTPRRIVAAGMGYVILGMASGGSAPLHLLSQTGAEQIAFGPKPEQATDAILRAIANGSIVWDARRQRLTLAPESPYYLYSFSADGHLLRGAAVGGPEFQPTITDWATGMKLPGDRVTGIALLPSGGFATEVVRTRPTDSGTWRHDATVELLDVNFRVTARIDDPPGDLQGADDRGNLYFTRVAPEAGAYVTRSHLEPQP